MNLKGNPGWQVLVVDDEPTVRKAVKMLLEHDGHHAETVDSGEAALAVLKHRQFDLIITDFSMPGMKGDQLVARIKKQLPDQPIIMATAFVDEFNIFGRPEGGVDLLLHKPFSLDDLRDAVAQVLAGKNPVADGSLSIVANPPPPKKFIPPTKPQRE